MSNAVENPDNQPITPGTILRWVMILGVIGTVAYKFVGHDFQIVELQKGQLENDRRSTERDARQEAEIQENKQRIGNSEQNFNQLATKLDRVLTIVERLDKKAGQP